MESKLSPRKRLAFNLLLAFAVPLIGFFLLEGGSSLFLLGRDIVRAIPGPAGEAVSAYDTLLGWTNPPGLHIPNHFGPGEDLSVNAQGFRGTAEVPRTKPPDRLRVVGAGAALGRA